MMHMQASKRVLEYIRSSLNYGQWYKQGEIFWLIGCSDNDYADDQVDKKSTSGIVCLLGESVIKWTSQKRKIVTLLSCETEYIGLRTAARQRNWLSGLIEELTELEDKPMKIMMDKRSAVVLAEI